MEEYYGKNLELSTRSFLGSLALLCLIGMIMVFSSSYLYSRELYSSSLYIVARQLTFLSLGIGGCYVLSKTKFNFWWKFGRHLHLVVGFLVILTALPMIGHEVNGARRWLRIGPMSFQFGEFLKITSILYFLPFFQKFNNLNLKEKLIQGALGTAPVFALLLQPDYGTMVLCFIVIFFACYLSDFPRKIFYSVIPVGIISGGLLLVSQPYRMQRIQTFLDPWQSPQGSGFQLIQSWIAFANGHLFGKGLGNSHEKLFYLPEAHNDFIFSVLGEELGFIGVVFTICVFSFFLYRGFSLATSVASKSRSLVMASLIFLIGIQVLLNMSVVLGLLPTKGLNLPFISYGGSSMLANFACIGIFLSSYKSSQSFEFPHYEESLRTRS